jgi:hypothetical protein
MLSFEYAKAEFPRRRLRSGRQHLLSRRTRQRQLWVFSSQLSRLVGNGARVVSQVGEARVGFHFDCKLGKTVGSATITPLELTPLLSRITPRPNGVVDVHTSIGIAEKWFPKEPGLIQVSVNNSINR